MTSTLLSQALCGELGPCRMHLIQRPFVSLLHFVPRRLLSSTRNQPERQRAHCTATGSSTAALATLAPPEIVQQQQQCGRDEHEWPGLAAWRSSGVDDRRHWGRNGPERPVCAGSCGAAADLLRANF
jgi:hypothetical protein